MAIKKEKKLIRVLVMMFTSFTALGVIALYIIKNESSFRKILTVSFSNVSVFIVLQLALQIINSVVLLIYFKSFSKKISFFDSFGLNIITTFFNNIFVKGGPLVKGYFLKKIHGLSYSNFIFTVASFMLVELMAAGFLGIAIVWYVWLTRAYFNIGVFVFFAGVIALSMFIAGFPFSKFFKNEHNWVQRKLLHLSFSWQEINRNKPVMAQLLVLSFLSFFIFALRLQYGFTILGYSIDFVDCLLISIVGILSNFFAITPAGLGIREFMVGGAYKLMKGDMVHAVVVCVLDRVISVIAVFILGVIFIFYFLHKSRSVDAASSTRVCSK